MKFCSASVVSSLRIVVLGALLFLMAFPVLAEDGMACKKLYELSCAKRDQLQRRNGKQNVDPADNQALLAMVIDGADAGEQGATLFYGIDVDGDGKEDRVERGCGSGEGRLCSLLLTLSGGQKLNSDDMAFFYLARFGEKFYLVEDADITHVPCLKEQAPGVRLFAVQETGVQPICAGFLK